MKNFFVIIVLLLFAFPAFGQEVDLILTNQDGTRTTQFQKGDDIYLEGMCPIAESGLSKIYITNDETWKDGDTLYDVSSGIETILMDDVQIVRLKIWKTPLNEGTYDLVVDINNNFTHQAYEYCILGNTGVGFRVGSLVPPPPPPPPPPSPLPPPPPPPPPPSPLPPPPSPQSHPSAEFSLDTPIEVKSLANVRQSAGGLLLGEQDKGAKGIIVGGPVRASASGVSYWFWNVNFDEDPDGWVAESVLKTAPVPEPEPEPVIEETVIIEEPSTIDSTEPAPTELTEPPHEQTAAVEVSGVGDNVGMNSFLGAGIIGLAILFGLIFGSLIISRTLRKD